MPGSTYPAYYDGSYPVNTGDTISAPTSTDWSRAAANGLRGRLGPPSQYAMGVVANAVGATIVPAGCSNVGIVQRVNQFLDWNQGTGRAAVTLAAYAADPLAGVVASGAIAAFQQGTEAGCGSTTPLAPAYVTAGSTPIDTTLTAIQSAGGGGGGSGWADEICRTLLGNYVGHLRGAPWWWVEVPYSTSTTVSWEDYWLDLRRLDITSRNAGESAVDWLNRMLPAYNWQVSVGGIVVGVGNSIGLDVEAAVYAYWVWDMDASAPFSPNRSLPEVGWVKDFATYYKFENSPGVYWSVLGILADVISAQNITEGSAPFPPVTT